MILRQEIEDRIAGVFYQQLEASTTTIAHVTLDNGFSMVGVSACANAAEFDAGLGRQYAYLNAVDKLFPHFAFMQLEDKHRAKGEA